MHSRFKLWSGFLIEVPVIGQGWFKRDNCCTQCGRVLLSSLSYRASVRAGSDGMPSTQSDCPWMEGRKGARDDPF